MKTPFEIRVILEVRNKDGEVIYRDEGKAIINEEGCTENQ